MLISSQVALGHVQDALLIIKMTSLCFFNMMHSSDFLSCVRFTLSYSKNIRLKDVKR